MKEFTVEISRPGSFGALTSATLELPATWAEYQDAMQKARITDDRVIYNVEVSDCRRLFLEKLIPKPVHLLELNLLAQRLDSLSKRQSGIFDAMVIIEGKQNGGTPIPLPRLINFTHSLDNCRVAYGVTTDEALGKWLYSNDMLSENEHETALFKKWESAYADRYFALLGEKHRKTEGGAFSDIGYVEMETINEVYRPIPGERTFFDRSGAPVVLKVRKGFFDDPGYDNDLSITLNLPTVERGLDAALADLDAASWEECGWSCADCLIPAARGLIDDEDDIGAVNDFARALADMERHTNPALYKAMFEAVKPPHLEAATALVAETSQYALDAEMSGQEDYAREYLSRLQGGDDRIDLAALINPYALGAQVMKLENAEWTSYGVLKRKDGAPIQSQEWVPESGMEMT